ncbi:MAG: hypothetical protein IJ374_03945 [Lachnospiraceae bacterium]|nr:hypothetical protein [Lachnospiraceae bacterium]
MRGRSIRSRAKEGLPSFGLSVVLPCSSVIELAAQAGYDFVRIDCEHALFGAEELRALLTTARLVGMPCQLRIPDLSMVTPLLGQEAGGIMLPHIESVEEARRAIDACKFAPVGNRGMDGNTRWMRCGGMSRSEYMEYSTETMDLIVQIESETGIEHIDEILSLEGIDMVATGRADLSQSLGVAGQKNHPRVIEAENYIIKKALEHHKIPTIAADSAKRVQELYEMGVRCFVVGKDEGLLSKAIKKNLSEIKREGN